MERNFYERHNRHQRQVALLNPAALYIQFDDYLKHKQGLGQPVEECITHFQGKAASYDRKLKALITLKGFAQHIGWTKRRLDAQKDNGPDWAEALEFITEACEVDQLEGAAVGLLNAALIGKMQGLADKQEITGAGGGPIQTQDTTLRSRIASRVAGLASRVGTPDDSGGTD